MGTLETPANLGEQGSQLWSDVNDDHDLRVDELRILEDACREVDLIERLEEALRGQPLLVKGSMGQVVASPLVQELRQHRALVARLLGALRLTDGEEAGGELDARARSSQARQAALTRWRGAS